MKFLLWVLLWTPLPILANQDLSIPQERVYREAEQLERRLMFSQAIEKYQQVLEQKHRAWSRRAAYRIITLIRDIHFSAGRCEKVRRPIVSLYKSILADLPSMKQDPELWTELQKEIRWTRLGLRSPKMLF